MNATLFLQNFINALQWGSFYALIALGYTLVYGVLLLINFAHGDIFMVGAYIGFFVATFLLGLYGFQLPWALSPGLILVLTFLLTMALTAGVGVFIERVAYRPLRRKGVNRLIRRHYRPDGRVDSGKRESVSLGGQPKIFPGIDSQRNLSLGRDHLHQPEGDGDRHHLSGLSLPPFRGPKNQMGPGYAGHLL